MAARKVSIGQLADVQRFRRSFRGVAGSVAVILTDDGSGGVRGVTCTSAVSLSIDPPMMVLCLDDRTRMRELIESAGGFSTNYLASDYVWVAKAFAGRNQALDDAALSVLSGRTGVPTLGFGTTSVLECQVDSIHSGGDHSILCGRVQHARFQHDAAPLLYGAGHYGVFSTEP